MTAVELDAKIQETQEVIRMGIPYEDWTPEQRAEFHAVHNEDLPKTDDEWLELAASLTPIEYERQREVIAKRLEVRVGILDKLIKERRPQAESNSGNGEGAMILLSQPEPWPDPVSLSSVLTTISTTIQRFLVVSESAVTAITLWIIHTYAHEAANVSPVLAINSPEKRCGKTTLIELLTALVIRPLSASNLTPATIFRGVQAYHPTLLIDEADTFLNGDSDELRGILNSGHRRRTAIVLRTVGDTHEVKQFSTWCPKAIAAIGKLPDTLADRSIVIEMRRRSPDEKVEGLRFDRIAKEVEPVRRQAFRWFQDNRHSLTMAEPEIPVGIDDRAADNWRALLAIADAAGLEWAKLARQAATELCGNRDVEDESARTMLLTDIRNLFTGQKTDKLTSEDIVKVFGEMETRPWSEWKSGKPITQRQLAKLLKPFKIEPKVIRTLCGTPRGYTLDQFDDAFTRYLPSQSATSATTKKIKTLAEFRSATQYPNVADEKEAKPHLFNDVADVADLNGGKGKRI
jgi:putative DNA primase/helicase